MRDLVQVVKQHLRSYFPDIMELIKEFWTPHEPGVIQQIVSLVETMRMAFHEEFKCFLPWLVPKLVEVIEDERSERRELTVKIMGCFEVMEKFLEDFRHLILPVMCNTLSDPTAAPVARQACLSCLGVLCKHLDFQPYCAQILNAFRRVLQEWIDVDHARRQSTPMSPSHPSSAAAGPDSRAPLQTEFMASLCAVVENIGVDFMMFQPSISGLLGQLNLLQPRYEEKVQQLKVGGAMARHGAGASETPLSRHTVGPPLDEGHGVKPSMEVNPYALKKAWEISLRATQGDWNEWLSHFAAELLKQSPSAALRACAAMAQRYPPVTMQLFNSAFMSCYNDLSYMMQMEMMKALNSALNSPKLSAEALQVLLNLAEHMKHDVALMCKSRGDHSSGGGSSVAGGNPSLFDGQQLGDLAFRAQLYAKALPDPHLFPGPEVAVCSVGWY